MLSGKKEMTADRSATVGASVVRLLSHSILKAVTFTCVRHHGNLHHTQTIPRRK